MPEIALPRATIWYADHRNAAGQDVDRKARPPLFLLHGAGGTHLDWPGDLRRLAGWRAIVPDLPGHGRSDGPGRQTVEDYAADMLALLDGLGLDSAVVIGHSMGAAIGLMLALHHPQRVAGLVTLGGGARLPIPAEVLETVLSDPDQVYQRLSGQLWGAGVPEEIRALTRERMRCQDPRVVYGDYLACDRFDVRAALPAIRVRALVITGEEDRIVPARFSRTLAEGIPGAELVLIAGAGHMLALERPDAVAGALVGWLERQVAAGR